MYEPRPRVAAVFGTVFGVFIATVVVVVIGYMDTMVRTITNFASLVGAPRIGRIGYQPRLREGDGQSFKVHYPNQAAPGPLKSERGERSRPLRGCEASSEADPVHDSLRHRRRAPELDEGDSRLSPRHCP